jgi:hypothetical protein
MEFIALAIVELVITQAAGAFFARYGRVIGTRY